MPFYMSDVPTIMTFNIIYQTNGISGNGLSDYVANEVKLVQ